VKTVTRRECVEVAVLVEGEVVPMPTLPLMLRIDF
jgi:hypothetical protein